jgi:hypothetical protein
MAFGPLALLLLALGIARNGGGWLTASDGAYLMVLLAMLACRWLEFRSGQGLTAAGEPVTRAQLYRYLAVTGVLGLAAWAVANVLGNYR